MLFFNFYEMSVHFLSQNSTIFSHNETNDTGTAARLRIISVQKQFAPNGTLFDL